MDVKPDKTYSCVEIPTFRNVFSPTIRSSSFGLDNKHYYKWQGLVLRAYLCNRKINIRNDIDRYKPQDSIMIDIDTKLNPFPNVIFPDITLDITIQPVTNVGFHL